MTHLCISKLSIIGSDNGLSPGRRQAIIWTNAGILLIGTRGTNFNEISIKIHEFSFKKIHLKMSSGKWRPSCLGLNVLMWCTLFRLTRPSACPVLRPAEVYSFFSWFTGDLDQQSFIWHFIYFTEGNYTLLHAIIIILYNGGLVF